MKAFRILTGLFVLVALLGMGVHSAQAAFPFTYTSGFQVQNIDPNNDASVTINFYDVAGAQPVGSTISDTITKGSSKTYFPLTGLPSGFQGSVVVSSSTKVASVVNILGTGTAGNAAGASYVGAMAGGTPITIPLLMQGNNGFNTWFSVQNTGGAATDVMVTYSDGLTASKTALAPGAAVIFDQSTEAHAEKVFSGSVASPTSVPLAVAVVEEDTKTMFAYSGFTAGSTNVVIPLINSNNSGFLTGTQVMNTGASDTDVTITYTPSTTGTVCTEKQTVPHDASRTFTFYAFTTGNPQPPEGGMVTDCAGGVKFIGSAQVTANSAAMPLVAITNQLNPGINGEANNDFDPTTGTAQVVLPLIMDRNSGYFTGFSVVNVGAAAVDINCTFTGTTFTVSQTGVDPFTALTAIQNGVIDNKYVGSASCAATGTGSKLVAVVNELNLAAGDNLFVYEGISVTP